MKQSDRIDASQRERTRQRYAYSCGYCGVHESDVGATLTVDHHHPIAHGGANDDENLVYCCHRCNEHKGVYWHEVQVPYIRLLHPFEDNLTLHLREQPNSQFIGKTSEGRFYIQRLRLNRPQLIAYRHRKSMDQKRQDEIKSLRQQIHNLQQELVQLNSSLQEILTEINRETD